MVGLKAVGESIIRKLPITTKEKIIKKINAALAPIEDKITFLEARVMGLGKEIDRFNEVDCMILMKPPSDEDMKDSNFRPNVNLKDLDETSSKKRVLVQQREELIKEFKECFEKSPELDEVSKHLKNLNEEDGVPFKARVQKIEGTFDNIRGILDTEVAPYGAEMQFSFDENEGWIYHKYANRISPGFDSQHHPFQS
ncbi:hypothetical protein NHQ30_008578 [Ciborinia camelliae]|nr:hypothetical protein NHQ30_008578 [Ciborinia camelliae]